MNILEKIIEHKKIVVERAKRLYPVTELKDSELYYRQPISMVAALNKAYPGIIAESKKASPSKGILRNNYQPSEIATSYYKAGATAISVLTDEEFRRGNLLHLAEIRKDIPLPLLRKDFIIDSYQLHESKAYGADCILLIVAALSPLQFNELYNEALSLGFDVLVEVHTESELEKIPLHSMKLVGINNRDLTSFNVDITTTLRVARNIPSYIVLVSESGILTKDDILFLLQNGVKNFLIGEAFMKALNPGAALQALLKDVRDV